MKQLDIFETDYESCNYTDTSQQALATIKPKIKTKREQVYDFVKLQSSTNYEIADELEMPLSSVCGRVHELQELNLVVNSGMTRKTKYGKRAIVWKKK
jgi:Mn-dependent DtxR family transcriptional regulator